MNQSITKESLNELIKKVRETLFNPKLILTKKQLEQVIFLLERRKQYD